jgi:hypothetical protein
MKQNKIDEFNIYAYCSQYADYFCESIFNEYENCYCFKRKNEIVKEFVLLGILSREYEEEILW